MQFSEASRGRASYLCTELLQSWASKAIKSKQLGFGFHQFSLLS